MLRPRRDPDVLQPLDCRGLSQIAGERLERIDRAAAVHPAAWEDACAREVAKVVRLLREVGVEPASPAEARDLLGLKGGDKVGF